MILERAQSLKQAARTLLNSLDDRGLIEERIALGISVKDEGDYGLAVRVQSPARNRAVEKLLRTALLGLVPSDDLDVQYTGPVVPIPPAKLKKSTEVLGIGSAIAHVDTPAAGGTLGFFAKCRRTGERGFVSANHVIGQLDRADVGDEIVRPDGKVIGKFVRSEHLRGGGEKHVDASFARLETRDFDPSSLPQGHKLCQELAAPGETTDVSKFGAKTALRHGVVTSFDYDCFKVLGYSDNLAEVDFENQIEVVPANALFNFGRRGDSGSLVYNTNHRAVGLLFAVTLSRRAYVNPIQFVLDELEVDLLT